MSSFLSELEVCEKLGVSRVFLYQCRLRGMPYFRLGSKVIRYNLDEVLEWFEKQDGKNFHDEKECF